MPKAIIFVLTLFFGVMFLVTLAAYARRSGNTGLDIGKIHEIRQQKGRGT